jgi:hypothetical protein
MQESKLVQRVRDIVTISGYDKKMVYLFPPNNIMSKLPFHLKS